MVSVAEALHRIESRSTILKVEEVNLSSAFGAVLAEDIFSPMHMPPFRQSAMDGYAIRLGGCDTYRVIGESKAGEAKNITINDGEAVRIYTGALVPNSADTVVIQEHIEKTFNEIRICKSPSKYSNIRAIGEQIKKGAIVLRKGTELKEAAIGFLAGLGINKAKVYKAPTVAILVTGNELQQSGELLQPGCVYESNSVMLEAALVRIGIKNLKICKVKDNLEETKQLVESTLQEADVLLVSGGISVGDYDFVKEALETNNVQEIFYKVNQKPGKPLWYGKKGKKTVFALPGNPASSLTCFYVYVLPALRKMMGHENFYLERKKTKVASEIKKPIGKMLFLKAIVQNGYATILDGQSSSMLNSYAISNALVCVPEDVEMLHKGDEVAYLNLNF